VNLPNRLTLTRLALVPAFMCFMVVDNVWTRIAALFIFIGASLTDWYDGVIARRTRHGHRDRHLPRSARR